MIFQKFEIVKISIFDLRLKYIMTSTQGASQPSGCWSSVLTRMSPALDKGCWQTIPLFPRSIDCERVISRVEWARQWVSIGRMETRPATLDVGRSMNALSKIRRRRIVETASGMPGLTDGTWCCSLTRKQCRSQRRRRCVHNCYTTRMLCAQKVMGRFCHSAKSIRCAGKLTTYLPLLHVWSVLVCVITSNRCLSRLNESFIFVVIFLSFACLSYLFVNEDLINSSSMQYVFMLVLYLIHSAIQDLLRSQDVHDCHSVNLTFYYIISKTFQAMPTHTMNIFVSSFIEIPPVNYRDIAPRELGVNGQRTAGPKDGQPKL